MRFQWDTQEVNWQELERLFKLNDLAGREGDKIRRAFENSTAVCFAFEHNHVIAAARALSDREYHATIYDVVVHPNYQRRGVGTRLMNELMRQLPVWRMMLVADGEAAKFYKRLGFEPYGDVLARLDQTRLYDKS